MILNQRTIKKEIKFNGIGLHSGKITNIKVLPAPPNYGIVFRRVDLPIPQERRVRHDLIKETQLCTCFSINENIQVNTIEHFMAALALHGVDNAIIELDNEEFPIMDGSSIVFSYLIQESGILNYSNPKKFLRIKKEIIVKDNDKFIIFKPSKLLDLKINYTIDFDNHFIKNTNQTLEVRLSSVNIENEISRARTFGFVKDLDMLKSLNLAQGGSTHNAILLDEYKMMNDSPLRYEDEFVRHKILDSVGDFYMCGHQIIGEVSIYKGGHKLNNEALLEIYSKNDNYEIIEAIEIDKLNTKENIDINDFSPIYST